MKTKTDTLKSLEQTMAMASRFIAAMESVAFQQDGFAELSMRQVSYVETIARLGQPRLSELAEALAISRPSVTVLVGKLIRKGFVQKVQDGQDRRSFRIVLTEKGRQYTGLHKNVHARMVETMVARLDETEIEQLAVLLKKSVGA